MTDATTDTRVNDEANALLESVGFRVRDDLRLVRVRGEDRVTWLNGQITSDVRKIPAQGSVHSLSVNVRGKVMTELWVIDRGHHLAILLPQSAQTTVLESFERFIIMEDVVLEPDDVTRIVSVQGPRAQTFASSLANAAEHTFVCDELGIGGVFVLTDAAALQAVRAQAAAQSVLEISDAGFELARLRSARPRFGIDYDERSYPQEAGLKDLLSFNKGCYLGQEVVCTLESRGRVNRRLCVLHAGAGALPRAGAALSVAESESCGEITSAQRDPSNDRVLALGYVKRLQAIIGNTLQCGDQSFVVHAIVGEKA